MTKAGKLRLCNWSLLVAVISVLASGLWLEAVGGGDMRWVPVHMAIAAVFVSLAVVHIGLHFGYGGWFVRFGKVRSRVTMALWVVFLLTLFSALAASIHWSLWRGHSPIGGVHGKIGLVMVGIAIVHIVSRIGFFRRRVRR